jgi:hypothetical protein
LSADRQETIPARWDDEGRLCAPQPMPRTADEWARVEWPACRGCGAQIRVALVDVTTFGDPEPVYLMGRHECTAADHNPGLAVQRER